MTGSYTQSNERFIVLHLYQGLIQVGACHRSWSTKSLYQVLWTRFFMLRDQFNGILRMLHIVDPCTENNQNKLKKLGRVLEEFKNACRVLHQPIQTVALDQKI